MLYFDHAASTPIREEVLTYYLESLKSDFANASSSHLMGRAIKQKIEGVRKKVLDYLNLRIEDYSLVFTSSATESNNLVFNSVLAKRDLFLSIADHPSIVLGGKHYFQDKKITYLKHDEDGQPLFDKRYDLKNGLLSLSLVNGTFGIILDSEIIKKIKEQNPNLMIHLDLSQAIGKVKDDYSIADYIVFSSHKIGAPKGVSCLVYRKKNKIHPLLIGGGQEEGLRSSTLNAPAILALGKTIDTLMQEEKNEIKRLTSFKENLITYFENKHKMIIPFKNSSPHILTVIIKDYSGDMVQRFLEKENIIVATSAACSSHKKKNNEMYRSLNVPEKYHNGVLRISFGHNTTLEDVEVFKYKFDKIMNKLKAL